MPFPRSLVKPLLLLLGVGILLIATVFVQLLWIMEHPADYEDIKFVQSSKYVIEGVQPPAVEKIRNLLSGPEDELPTGIKYMLPLTAHRLAFGPGVVLASRITVEYPFKGFFVSDTVTQRFQMMTIYLPAWTGSRIEVAADKPGAAFAFLTSGSISYWIPHGGGSCLYIAASGHIEPQAANTLDRSLEAEVFLQFETNNIEHFRDCRPLTVKGQMKFERKVFADLGPLEGNVAGPVIDAEYLHPAKHHLLMGTFPILAGRFGN